MFNLSGQSHEKYVSTVQQLAYKGWHREQARRVTVWRREAADLKDRQQEMEDKLRCHA